MTVRCALHHSLVDAPADTPWLLAPHRYYTFFEWPNVDFIGVFFALVTGADGEPVSRVQDTPAGTIHSKGHSEVYDAVHAVQNRGYVGMEYHPSYTEFVSRMGRMELTPAELDEIIKATA